ncbi:MAG: hypothetical protein RIG77_18090 [Cyclobacteriaceae bacterium]
MGAINFIAAPFYLFILYALAFILRPLVTNRDTARYFIPALTAKFVGAISLGLIYQFYYKGGDTIAAYHNGAAQIWEAFLDSPILAFKLITSGTEYDGTTYLYARKIIAFGDLPTYFIVRVAGVFSLITFNSYYGNALFFATVSFSGSWAMYYSFYRLYPGLNKKIAIITLFIPSVVFWGSGILKDTITFAAVGWFFFAFVNVFIQKRNSIINIPILLISALAILHIKIYIALCLFPSFILLLFIENNARIKNKLIKIVITPIILVVAVLLATQSVDYLGSINRLYSLEQFTYRAQVNAEWLAYVSRRQGGSYYSLGNDNDFSNMGMAKKFIPAVWTTFCRPYLWEVKNPIMLLSALESLFVLLFMLNMIRTSGPVKIIKKTIGNPIIFSFLLYSVLFAFAIGVSTYNFGTLVRYKIPMLPFFLMALLLLQDRKNQANGYNYNR